MSVERIGGFLWLYRCIYRLTHKAGDDINFIDPRSLIWLDEAVKRILIGLMVVLCFVLVVSYFFLFSPLTSNYKIIIYVRNTFAMTVSDVRRYFHLPSIDNCALFFQPIYLVQYDSNQEYKYTYIAEGYLERVDEKNDYLVFRCSIGITYQIKTPIVPTKNGWVAVLNGINTDWSNPITARNPFLFYENDLKKSGEQDRYFHSDSMYRYVWKDKRDLVQIYREMKNDPNKLINTINSESVGIYR